MFLCLLLALSCCCWITATEPVCKQQGLLMLDEPHPPYRVRLPFCDKYRCSCCNASHALAIQRSVAPLLADEELGLACKAGLVALACRLCDPRVGVGNVTTVCESMCDRVYEACSEDYFAFDESSGLVTPCTGQQGGSLVCSQLQQVVPSGADFCRAAGYTPSESSSISSSSSSSVGSVACFDGSPVAAEECTSAAPPQKQRGGSKTSSSSSSSSSKRRSKKGSSSSSSSSSGVWPFTKLKRRHKRMVAEVAQLVAGALTSTLVAAGIVLLLQRVMQPAALAGRAAGRGQQGVPLQAAASRDRLAQAAESRAAGAGSRAAAAPAASAAQQQQQQQQNKK
uniref:Folate receptor-like domain-containing protein n=1 Tax=Tetradesmus obliquus TaxID=3088 RepID=A0A383WEW0_TETOB|eukprot:jgi/Sobl393_1/5103/SZX75951.1